MQELRGFQKKYLRQLAHKLKPVVMLGQKGITPMLIKTIDEALDQHELIKIKFIEFKEKDQKKTLCEKIAHGTSGVQVGMIGHIGIFYRQHSDPRKRRITLPTSE